MSAGPEGGKGPEPRRGSGRAIGGMDVLHRAPDPDVLLVAVGVLAPLCLQTADLLAGAGIRCTVVDPRWVKPLDEQLPVLAAQQDAGVDVPLRSFGVPDRFLAHAGRGDVLAEIGLTPVEIAGRVSTVLERRAAAGVRIRPKENGA